MAFAPQHDWETYDSIVSKHELKRQLAMTPQEKFERYANLFNMLHAAKPNRSWDHPAEVQRWKEKLEIRMRYLNAFIRPKEK